MEVGNRNYYIKWKTLMEDVGEKQQQRMVIEDEI